MTGYENSLFDRIKRRLAYLGTKAAAHILVVVGSITFFVFAAITVIFSIFSRDAHYQFQFVAVTLVSAVVAIAGALVWLKSADTIRSIPVVPPVREQPATFAPDEVLLRGARRLSVGDDDLVRAAATRGETRAEDLLRAETQADLKLKSRMSGAGRRERHGKSGYRRKRFI